MNMKACKIHEIGLKTPHKEGPPKVNGAKERYTKQGWRPPTRRDLLRERNKERGNKKGGVGTVGSPP